LLWLAAAAAVERCVCVVMMLHLQIAKAEKLKPMEVELKKLEDLSESIVNDFAYMRAREEEMRDTNGALWLVDQKYDNIWI